MLARLYSARPRSEDSGEQLHRLLFEDPREGAAPWCDVYVGEVAQVLGLTVEELFALVERRYRLILWQEDIHAGVYTYMDGLRTRIGRALASGARNEMVRMYQ